jgi:hypothetical protein
MATRKRSPTTAPGNGGRSRSLKGVPLDVLARVQNLRSRTGERRYLDPVTGRTYSERTISNAREGGRSKEAAQFARRIERTLGRGAKETGERNYERLLKDYQQAQFLRTGKRPTLRNLRKASTTEGRAFRQVVADLTSMNKRRKRRALVRLGYRPARANYAVGDSPTSAKYAEFRNSPLYSPNYRPDPKRPRAGEPKRTLESKRARITGRN